MCDGDGEVQREGRRAIYEPPTSVVWRSGKERCGGGQESSRVQAKLD